MKNIECATQLVLIDTAVTKFLYLTFFVSAEVYFTLNDKVYINGVQQNIPYYQQIGDASLGMSFVASSQIQHFSAYWKQ